MLVCGGMEGEGSVWGGGGGGGGGGVVIKVGSSVPGPLSLFGP